jgi:hypothetical protein
MGQLKSYQCLMTNVIEPLMAKYDLSDLYWIEKELAQQIACLEDEE